MAVWMKYQDCLKKKIKSNWSSAEIAYTNLTLILPSKILVDNILNFFFLLFFTENKAELFMWIVY